MPYSTKYTATTLVILICTALLTACSGGNDDSRSTSASKSNRTSASAVQPKFDHSHKPVTDLVKHQFEHRFADQCVAREARNSPNPELDRKRWSEPCMCIAQFMLKDLTAKEAELFLRENKDTQSLRIRFENAAYHCLQAKQSQVKAPQLFGRKQ